MPPAASDFLPPLANDFLPPAASDLPPSAGPALPPSVPSALQPMVVEAPPTMPCAAEAPPVPTPPLPAVEVFPAAPQLAAGAAYAAADDSGLSKLTAPSFDAEDRRRFRRRLVMFCLCALILGAVLVVLAQITATG